VKQMQDLLYRLTTTPVNEGLIWIILLILVFISLLLVITKFEDSDKLTSIFISLIIFVATSILFVSFQNHINKNVEIAITKKEYTLTLNGAVLELTSNSPYLNSEILEVVYQDDKRFQIKYHNQYYDIDKSQEKIDVKN
jgi:hypothetical protein